MKIHIFFLFFLIFECSQQTDFLQLVPVNKCCEPDDIYNGEYCTSTTQLNTSAWRPIFDTKNTDNSTHYRLVIGLPDCTSKQPWSIYHNATTMDRLQLLQNGVLRHFINYKASEGHDDLDVQIINGENAPYHDYLPGKYCMDKVFENGTTKEFARVCSPDYKTNWSTEYLMRNIVSPITHVFSICCLIIIAVVYFIMPPLRDLVGNMVTTISMCLVVNQVGDLLRLLSVFNSHISIITTESICYIGLLGAFFWLNSLGYYIWKTFRSRNVFLRVTDGRKYCYYSSYAWSCTIILSVLAVFTHYTMDYSYDVLNHDNEIDQEQIGSLGLIIFFVPIAFLILMNVFFVVTTSKVIGRMNPCGRIHHKLKHSFRLFCLLFITMTIHWIFFLVMIFRLYGLITCYVIVNAIEGPIIFYICVLNQKHVRYLIKKSCCYNCDMCCQCCQPERELDWDDEMTAMNTFIN